MYYHRVIVNFQKTAATPPYFLRLLVDIEQDGNGLGIYPKNWTGNYIIAYGIMGSVSNIDADKVYDYHTAFDILPTEIKMNVPLDMDYNAITNSPSIKPEIVTLPGKFNSSKDGNYVYFGGANYIIAPLNCKMTKCFF